MAPRVEFKLISSALYIQSEARQDIAFHLPGGRMSEVLPSQKVTCSWILIRAVSMAISKSAVLAN